MVLGKEIRVVDNVARLSVNIYLYLSLFKSKKNHLSEKELEVYSNLLILYVQDNLKKGAISKNMAKKNGSVYTYIERIKAVGLLKKNGDDFIFPPDMKNMAQAVVNGEDITFSAKVYGG